MLGSVLLLAGLLLGDDASAEEAIKRFKTAFRSPSVPARVGAVGELSRELHEKTAKTLIPLLSSDVPEVRAAAAGGLGGFVDFKKLVVPPLLGSLGGPNQKEAKVRAAIITSLGKLNDESAIPSIYQAFKDDYISVAKAAVMATVSLKRKEAIDQIIDLLRECQKWIKQNQGGGYKDDAGGNGDQNAQKARVEDLQKSILKSLQDQTGEKWPTLDEWLLWWAKKKPTFEFPKK